MKKILALILLFTFPALAARDGAGNYTISISGYPFVTNTIINSTTMNSILADISTALTDSLSRSGKGGMQASFLLSDGSSATPALAFTNEQTSGWYRFGTKDVRLSLLGTDAFRITDTFVSLAGWKIPNYLDLTMFFPGKMTNAQVLARLAFTSSTRLQANLPAAVFLGGVAAAASTVVTLKKRTSGGSTTTIGTLTWATSGTVPTVSFTVDVDFAAGDFFEIDAPATADANLSDVSITVQARRL